MTTWINYEDWKFRQRWRCMKEMQMAGIIHSGILKSNLFDNACRQWIKDYLNE